MNTPAAAPGPVSAAPSLPARMPVKSADRVIAILELFDLRQKALNLTEIASELGYPMSSTLAILQSLCARQYILFDSENKTYEPTLRVSMMGGWIMGNLFQGGTVIAFMQHLQKDTGETIILGARNGLYAQYLHTVQSRELLRFYLPPGLLRPMTNSALGKALLARYSNQELKALVVRLNKESVLEKNLIKPERLIADIDQVRKQGYAYSDRLTEGIAAIGMAIPLALGDTRCAIVVTGPAFRLKRKREKVVELIKQHANLYLRPGHKGFGHV